MKIDDLITVGSLGKSLNKNGFFKYKSLLELPQESKLVNEVFLIFRDHRVRFVDVEFSDNNRTIKVQDQDLIADIIESDGVKIAISKENLDELRIEIGLIPSRNMNIVFQDEVIGNLVEIFDNRAHEILVVKLINGKEVMIPYVDHFVIDSDDNRVIVKNIEGLLEL
ncbi:ribosome maturation factor RimM [Candidatus Cloacimonadota bacterium]